MRILRMVLFAALVSFPPPAMARADAPAGDAAVAVVEELEHARQHAMVAVDIEALAGIVADDFTYIHSTGLAQTRDELFAMLTRGDVRYVAFRVESVSYRAYGAVVVGTGVQSIDLTSSEKPLTSRSRYMVVYAPVGGSHRLLSYQATAMPEIVRQETGGDRKAP